SIIARWWRGLRAARRARRRVRFLVLVCLRRAKRNTRRGGSRRVLRLTLTLRPGLGPGRCDTMPETHKSGPGSVGSTVIRGLTTSKEWLWTSLPYAALTAVRPGPGAAAGAINITSAGALTVMRTQRFGLARRTLARAPWRAATRHPASAVGAPRIIRSGRGPAKPGPSTTSGRTRRSAPFAARKTGRTRA